MKTLISPLARISFGLVMLTIGILVTGDIFFPTRDSQHEAVLEARKLCFRLIEFFSLVVSLFQHDG